MLELNSENYLVVKNGLMTFCVCTNGSEIIAVLFVVEEF